MDPVQAALEAYRPRDPEARLRQRVREAGRLSLDQVTQTVIRDKAQRQAAISAVVSAGVVRVDVVPTGHHPRVDLVWVGGEG